MRRLLKDEGAMEILAIIGLIAVAAAGLVGITIVILRLFLGPSVHAGLPKKNANWVEVGEEVALSVSKGYCQEGILFC